MTASPINETQLIESGGMHFVDLWLDGHEMQRRGPFASQEPPPTPIGSSLGPPAAAAA